MIGKVHYPHTHLIDYGVHSITMKMVNDKKQKSI